MDFFVFDYEYSKTAIKVESESQIPTSDLFDYTSPLIQNNKFVKVKGKNLYDFLPLNDSLGYLVSDKVKEIVESNNLIELDFFPVEILDMDVQYYGAIFTAKCGPDEGFKYLEDGYTREFEFNLKNWDGSDFFVFQDTRVKVCTGRVKELFEENKIKRLEFEKVKLL